MTTGAVGKVGSLFVVSVALLLVGCPGAGTTGGGGTSGAGGKSSSDDLTSKIGDYLPPLDGGKLEIAAPKGWDWANPGGGVLVAFKPKDAEINSLPRVLLSVEESAAGIDEVTPDNVEAFVRQVSESLSEPKPKEPVRAVQLGKHHFARYVTFAKRRNQVVAQQTLKTVAGGRAYTLRLEAYHHTLDKYQAAVSVAAMSMKFAGEDAGQAAAPAATEPEAAKPEAEEPESGKPESSKPDVVKPEAKEPPAEPADEAAKDEKPAKPDEKEAAN